MIGSELAGMTAVEFVRVLSNSREWRKISVIAITKPSTRALNAELEASGVLLANKPTWKDDVPRLLSTFAGPLDWERMVGVVESEAVLAG